jgi:hypothetical protein
MDSSKRSPLKKASKNNNSIKDIDQGHDSLSSLDFDASLSDKLHSSLGSLDSSSIEDLDFLTKSSSSFRWKNKKHWKSMAGSKRFERSGNNNHQTDEDQESQQRRSAIRDSLMDALDAPDVF